MNFFTSSNDSWITTKINSKLLSEANINPTRIKVITENKTVFLIGLVTEQEAEIASDTARRVANVEKVVLLFDIIEQDNDDENYS